MDAATLDQVSMLLQHLDFRWMGRDCSYRISIEGDKNVLTLGSGDG